MTYDDAFDALMGHEGGYSNNPADPGGETMWGITARVARAEGYQGPMRDMPKDTAKAIAKRRYWDVVCCDQMPPFLRYPLFDAAYNSGPSQAIKWLQRALNVKDDGVLGAVTLKAAQDSSIAVAARMLGYRLDFMTSLPTWATFGKGWSRRVAAILQEA